MQCLGVLARVGRCGPSVLGSEARTSVLHRNLRRGAFGALWTPACQSNLALLVLGVVGRSLGWVAGGLAGSLGILWLAVHWWLLTEAVVRNYHQVFTRFDKQPECDNADLDQPKKFRIGPEHWTVIIQRIDLNIMQLWKTETSPIHEGMASRSSHCGQHACSPKSKDKFHCSYKITEAKTICLLLLLWFACQASVWQSIVERGTGECPSARERSGCCSFDPGQGGVTFGWVCGWL